MYAEKGSVIMKPKIEYTMLPFGFHIFLKMSRYVWYKRQNKFNLRLILQSVFWQKVVPLKSVHSTLWCETYRVIWTFWFWKNVSADLFLKVIFTIPWDQTIFHSPSFYCKDAGISKTHLSQKSFCKYPLYTKRWCNDSQWHALREVDVFQMI